MSVRAHYTVAPVVRPLVLEPGEVGPDGEAVAGRSLVLVGEEALVIEGSTAELVGLLMAALNQVQRAAGLR